MSIRQQSQQLAGEAAVPYCVVGVGRDGALVKGASRPANKLLMVLHALRLECEKSMELTASSRRSCFFCPSRDSRDEAALTESVPTGVSGEGAIESLALFVAAWHIVLPTATWDALFACRK